MNELKQTLTERRRQTRNRVYRCIFSADEPVSKQEIAGGLGLSLPTVHQNITELMEAGLVRDGERKMSTGGRPPMGYEADERGGGSEAAADRQKDGRPSQRAGRHYGRTAEGGTVPLFCGTGTG